MNIGKINLSKFEKELYTHKNLVKKYMNRFIVDIKRRLNYLQKFSTETKMSSSDYGTPTSFDTRHRDGLLGMNLNDILEACYREFIYTNNKYTASTLPIINRYNTTAIGSIVMKTSRDVQSPTIENALTDTIMKLEIATEEHDTDKLKEPLKSSYDKYTEELNNLSFSSDKLSKLIDQYKEFSKSHYDNADHHPNKHNGVQNMPIPNLIEMLCDWCARLEQTSESNLRERIYAYIDKQAEELKFDNALASILKNSADDILLNSNLDTLKLNND